MKIKPAISFSIHSFMYVPIIMESGTLLLNFMKTSGSGPDIDIIIGIMG